MRTILYRPVVIAGALIAALVAACRRPRGETFPRRHAVGFHPGHAVDRTVGGRRGVHPV